MKDAQSLLENSGADQPVRERTALMRVAVDALKAAGCGLRWEVECINTGMPNRAIYDLKLEVRLRLRPEDVDITAILERADK